MEKSKAKAIVAKAINDGGITIENGEIARHTDGYQYADYGISTSDIEQAVKAVIAFDGNCGLWVDRGIIYVDHSIYQRNRELALQFAREHDQLTIYEWSTGRCIDCATGNYSD